MTAERRREGAFDCSCASTALRISKGRSMRFWMRSESVVVVEIRDERLLLSVETV